MSACFTPFWVSSRAQQGNPHTLRARLLHRRKYEFAETNLEGENTRFAMDRLGE